MKFSAVAPFIKDLQYTSFRGAKELYKYVLKNKYADILELGTAFGKATVVMAAALDELGRGQIDTVDLAIADKRFWNGSCAAVAERAGLRAFINIHNENHTYNWFLKKKLEKQKRGSRFEPLYDFVFIDGAHNFSVDGLAFHLCDRLLKPGGSVLFDDLKYNYFEMNEQQDLSNEIQVDTYDPRARVAKAQMGEDELKACHIGLVYELLVKTHPQYGNFRYSHGGNWGYATKA